MYSLAVLVPCAGASKASFVNKFSSRPINSFSAFESVSSVAWGNFSSSIFLLNPWAAIEDRSTLVRLLCSIGSKIFVVTEVFGTGCFLKFLTALEGVRAAILSSPLPLLLSNCAICRCPC